MARRLEFLDLAGSGRCRFLSPDLSLERRLLKLLSQRASPGPELNRFLLGGGVETLNLLPVLVMQALDSLAQRLSDLA